MIFYENTSFRTLRQMKVILTFYGKLTNFFYESVSYLFVQH